MNRNELEGVETVHHLCFCQPVAILSILVPTFLDPHTVWLGADVTVLRSISVHNGEASVEMPANPRSGPHASWAKSSSIARLSSAQR